MGKEKLSNWTLKQKEIEGRKIIKETIERYDSKKKGCKVLITADGCKGQKSKEKKKYIFLRKKPLHIHLHPIFTLLRNRYLVLHKEIQCVLL